MFPASKPLALQRGCQRRLRRAESIAVTCDAYRKEQRKKEINRNKLERKYTRDAVSNRDKPEEIKKQLQEVLKAEDDGTLSKALKLKKKVLQEAYDAALKKKREEDLRKRAGAEGAGTAGAAPFDPAIQGAAAASIRPEDSRYYHPTLNPTGAPPPGKLAAALITAPAAGSKAGSAAGNIPLPKAPPLPAGPAPKLPAPPAAPPLPSGPAPGQPSLQEAPLVLLPAPPGPPPGWTGEVLPPPTAPPPGWRLPPPSGPPPGMLAGALPPRMPPPPGPPPGYTGAPSHSVQQQAIRPGEEGTAAGMEPAGSSQQGGVAPLPPPLVPPPQFAPGMPLMPPPAYPPPGAQQQPNFLLPPPSHPPPGHATQPAAATSKAAGTGAGAAAATITAAATVVKRPLAHLDKSLTSMVPASVRVKREAPKQQPVRPAGHVRPADSGFGLAPIPRAAITSAPDIDDGGTAVARTKPGAAAPASKPAAVQGAKAAAPQQQATPVSADAQYQEFLASMREMGAL
ncbi:hypothetical protein QJQ45_005552 [Haematococcus lacustris]|nr:hypothetical protein QJQ45_005552 [Haematococcus lacustris]